jgi:hypothetical protein
MKRVKIVIPAAQDEAAAQFLYEKNVRVLLSYSKDEFFDSKIVIICGVPDEALTDFNTHFKTNIK